MKWILSFFILLLLWNPLQSNAASADSPTLIINLEKPSQNTLVPGDVFTETFSLENISSSPVKVRVRQVTNEEDSPLFSVIQGNWGNSENLSSLQPLEYLITDWFYIDSKETLTLPLTLHFPASCGNEYQNALLKAKFLFEYQTNTETNSYESSSKLPVILTSPATNNVTKSPSTGDSQGNILCYLTLCGISWLLVNFLNIYKKYPGV